MRTRFRTLTALLALVAFSASFAEQVWASTCAPVAAEAARHHPAAYTQADGRHGAMEIPAVSARHSAPDAPDECPVQAVAGGCIHFSFAPRVREAPAPGPA